MIPISDDNPAKLRPYATWSFIILCIAVFIWQLTFSEEAEDQLIETLGFMPVNLTEISFQGDHFVPWSLLTLFTSMFLHGGFLHLGGNMLYLWIFGNNVEDAMGHIRYLIFYLVCGVIAALTMAYIDTNSHIPMIGASGAISGVLAAYVLLYPRARVTVIVPLGIIFYPMAISAVWVVGFWFVLQLASAVLTDPGQPGVAFWAHVGGFAAGLVLTPILKSKQYPLFARTRRGPWG